MPTYVSSIWILQQRFTIIFLWIGIVKCPYRILTILLFNENNIYLYLLSLRFTHYSYLCQCTYYLKIPGFVIRISNFPKRSIMFQSVRWVYNANIILRQRNWQIIFSVGKLLKYNKSIFFEFVHARRIMSHKELWDVKRFKTAKIFIHAWLNLIDNVTKDYNRKLYQI